MNASRVVIALATVAAACFDATGVVLRAQADADAATDAAADSPASPTTIKLASVAGAPSSVSLCVTPSGGPFATPVIPNIGPLAMSAPVTIDSGAYDLRVVPGVTATCGQAEAELLNQTLAGGAFTVIFLGDPMPADGGTTAHPYTLVLRADDAPSVGEALLRPFNAATQTSTVSLQELADASSITVTSNVGYGSAATQNASPNGFVGLAPGSHDLELVGPSATAALGTLDFASGDVYSLFAVSGSDGGLAGLVCDDLALDGGFASCTIR